MYLSISFRLLNLVANSLSEYYSTILFISVVSIVTSFIFLILFLWALSFLDESGERSINFILQSIGFTDLFYRFVHTIFFYFHFYLYYFLPYTMLCFVLFLVPIGIRLFILGFSCFLGRPVLL